MILEGVEYRLQLALAKGSQEVTHDNDSPITRATPYKKELWIDLLSRFRNSLLHTESEKTPWPEIFPA